MTPMTDPALRSLIDRVVVPALVERFLREHPTERPIDASVPTSPVPVSARVEWQPSA
jgi:hypothetical protein